MKKNKYFLILILVCIANTAFAQFPTQVETNQIVVNHVISKEKLEYFDFLRNPPPPIRFIDTTSSKNINIRTTEGMFLFSYPKSEMLKYSYKEFNSKLYGDTYKGRKGFPYYLIVGPPEEYMKLSEFIPTMSPREKKK